VADYLASRIVIDKSERRETKQLIYAHALLLFAARGYARTGLRDIAQAVGIEAASLYTHIESKQALLFDLMDYGTRDWLEQLTSVVNENDTPAAQMYELVRVHVATNCRRQAQTLVTFYEIRELSDEQRHQILPLREAIEALYIDTVTQGIQSGSMRPVNVRVAVHGILALERGVASWYRADGALSPDEVGEHYADQVLRGLLTAPLLAMFGDRPIRLTDLIPER
jgi:TetR/AcrR family transcriptional regulator, cholesterol catabolism regulator